MQLTTVNFFFYFDDYVPFGEAATGAAAARHIWNLLTAQVLTPNWRPLPGLLYLASFKLWDMGPLPCTSSRSLHVGTAALICALS